MATSTSNAYNSANLWSDLETLSNARKENNKYLLCIFQGNLASSSFQRDTREAKRSWSAWSSAITSGVSRTLSSGLGIGDNNETNVIDYLEKLITYVEKNKIFKNNECLTDSKVKILYEVATHSFQSLADEYSAKEEREKIEKGKTGSNIEGFGGIATKLSDFAQRIYAVVKQNSQFVSYQKSQKK